MPGLSGVKYVPGYGGIGKVKIRYKPIPKRKFPFGALLFATCVAMALFMWCWSKPWIRYAAILPVMRTVLKQTYLLKERFASSPAVTHSHEFSIGETEYGSLRISAPSLPDVLYGQGYAHASHRLYQLDLSRRRALGTLSEVFGDETLDSDRWARYLGIASLASNDLAHQTEEELRLLQSYADGINAYIDEKKPSIEQLSLPDAIAYWEPYHTLALLRLHAIVSQSVHWEKQLYQMYIFETHGAAALQELNFTSPPVSSAFGVPQELTDSNNAFYVINLITELTAPNTYHQITLDCPSLLVSGMSIPGIPLLWHGRSENTVWSVGPTSDRASTISIAEEIEATDVQRVKIAVKDEEPVLMDVHQSAVGLLIHHLMPFRSGTIYSYWARNIILASNSLSGIISFSTLLAINSANDALEVRAAATAHVIPYHVYAMDRTPGSPDNSQLPPDLSRISSQRKITFADVLLHLRNTQSERAAVLTKLLLSLDIGAVHREHTFAVYSAQDIVRAFDGSYEANSPAPVFLEVFYRRLQDIALSPLRSTLSVMQGTPINPLRRELLGGYNWLSIFDEGNKYWVGKAGGKTEIISRAAVETIAYLTDKFGHNPTGWMWEEIHTVRFNHAKTVYLGELLSVGPVASGGGAADTAWSAGYNNIDRNDYDPLKCGLFAEGCTGSTVRYAEKMYFPKVVRMVGELGSGEVDFFLVAPGQSGRGEHLHYDSQVRYWASGQVVPMHWKDASKTVNVVNVVKKDAAQDKEL